MPRFTSKLQYKNFEKGEFTDEKPRAIEEIITLLKNFPKPKDDGIENDTNDPSIVILDNDGNYLKIDIYPGNMFCIYYLTGTDQFYILDTLKPEAAFKQVTHFSMGK